MVINNDRLVEIGGKAEAWDSYSSFKLVNSAYSTVELTQFLCICPALTEPFCSQTKTNKTLNLSMFHPKCGKNLSKARTNHSYPPPLRHYSSALSQESVRIHNITS